MSEEKRDFYVEDNSSLHHYRTELPNIIFDIGLDPYEFALYSHIKRIAGDRGCCYVKRKNLLEKCGMKETKFKEVKKSLARRRPELGGKALIKIVTRKREDGGRRTDLISVTDVWGLNMQTFVNPPVVTTPVAKRPTPPPRCTPPGRLTTPPRSPNDRHKEEPIKEVLPKDRESQVANASMRLASLLFELILELNPNHKKPHLVTWGYDIDKLIRIDHWSAGDVEEVIRWTMSDRFWCGNVLSGRKLREKFDQLFLTMQSEKKDPKKKKSQEAKDKSDRVKSNRDWARSFFKKKGPIKKGDSRMILKDNGVEVMLNGAWLMVGLLELGFAQQVESLHRKIVT